MMKASEVMNTDITKIKGSATVTEAVKLMKEKGVRGLIVEKASERDAHGIVTETDIVYKVAAYGKDPNKVRVFEIMTKPCIIVNPDLGVENVARLFASTHIHRAPVIGNELLGVISISDILLKSDFIEKPKEILFEERIEKSIEEARAICKEKGASSKECAAAWDEVEELQAEAAHQRAAKLEQTAFEKYCEENPDAMESRIFDT